MSKIGYGILFGILRGLAHLPLAVLYAIADVIFFILYYVMRYRRRVVAKNLAESFPEMSDSERKKVARKFYRNFADYIVETVKLLHISDKEMQRRMQFEGIDIIDNMLDQGKPVVTYFSHCFNWEWATSFTLHGTHHNSPNVLCCQVYRPLRNVHFDRFMLKLRSRFHSVSLPKATCYRSLFRYAQDGVLTVTGFMSDQRPSHGDQSHVVEFLNHPTAVITGTETVARRLKAAAVYWDMHKLSRGHYRIVCRLLTDNASTMVPHALTDKYIDALQTTIEREPAIWLWTHKRWKIPVTQPSSQNEK